ncbi:MAG: hypothetical protein ACWGKN_11775 [Desulfoprunum sp.]|jgi:hypothetical protein
MGRGIGAVEAEGKPDVIGEERVEQGRTEEQAVGEDLDLETGGVRRRHHLEQERAEQRIAAGRLHLPEAESCRIGDGGRPCRPHSASWSARSPWSSSTTASPASKKMR